jgi:ubiquinone/menaquinone biosynthesis C-methylase UbiE
VFACNDRVVANDEDSYQYLVESIRRFPKQELLAEMMIDVNLSCVGYENLSGGIVAIHSAFKT